MYSEIWNRIVKHYNENYTEKEDVLQKDWELILSDYFGYRKLFGEIEAHRKKQIGSTQRIIPDIIIRSKGVDLFDVELKQYNLPITDEMESQLKSYMAVLHISVGILICQNLYLYVYNFNKDSMKRIEIAFVENNPDGIKFVELMQQGSFATEKVEEFIDSKLAYISNVATIKSKINKTLVRELLVSYFSKDFTEDEIQAALSELTHPAVISVPQKKTEEKKKTDVQPEVVISDINIADSIIQKLIVGKRAKAEAMTFVSKHGVVLNNAVTYACRQEKKAEYWANPDTGFLDEDWYIILNDNVERMITVLKVPAHTYKLKTDNTHGFSVRKDRTYYIDLNLSVGTLIDRNSQYDLRPYVIKSIKF